MGLKLLTDIYNIDNTLKQYAQEDHKENNDDAVSNDGEELPDAQLPTDESPPTLESIRLTCDVLSVESFAGLNALHTAVSRIPSLFNKAGRFFKSKFTLFSKQPDVVFSAHGLDRIYQKVNNKPYSDLQGIIIHGPEGLTVSFLKYARCLKKQAEIASRLLPDVLIPYSNWLGQTLANPEVLAQNTPRLNIQGFQQLNFDPIEKELQNCFVTHGQRTHRISYGNAFERNQDVLELSKELDEMTRLFSGSIHKEILDKNQRIANLLNDLIEFVGSNKGIKVSPVTIKALADTTYHTARLMEQYGVMRFRLLELDHSVKESVKILKSKA